MIREVVFRGSFLIMTTKNLFRSGIPTFYDNRYTYVSTALLRTITARGFHERLATGNTYNRRSTVANRTTT